METVNERALAGLLYALNTSLHCPRSTHASIYSKVQLNDADDVQIANDPRFPDSLAAVNSKRSVSGPFQMHLNPLLSDLSSQDLETVESVSLHAQFLAEV